MTERTIVIATDFGADGSAVFRHENRVGFIAGLLPGESGEVEIDVRGGVWRGRLVQRLSTSPEREPHPCPHAINCPASRFGCMTRDAELNAKRSHAESTLLRIGGIERSIDDIIVAGPEWGYRNKIELSVEDRGGTILIGYHPTNDPNRIIPIVNCLLGEDVLQQLLHTVNSQAKSSLKKVLQKVKRLTLRTGDGLHLHLTMNLELSQSDVSVIQSFFREYSGLVGITSVLSRNDTDAELMTRTIAGELLLAGHDGVFTHPLTFRQVNDSVARKLVSAVEEWCCDVVGVVFDLYGGYGPFARKIASTYGNETHILEMNETAIRDGQRALKKVPLPLTYHRCDVAKRFPRILPEAKPEAILLDPPYRGAGEIVINEILRRKPRKIGYIACHGAALARDLKLLLAGGYRLSRIRLFDMFPQTPDVEWFAELDKNV